MVELPATELAVFAILGEVTRCVGAVTDASRLHSFHHACLILREFTRPGDAEQSRSHFDEPLLRQLSEGGVGHLSGFFDLFGLQWVLSCWGSWARLSLI